ncbi:MAG: Ribosome-recycling factor [bacterium ADurb.Bin400]|nr:MAG: Ribosome-recycling factor [bacterium ADurb.Bin400]
MIESIINEAKPKMKSAVDSLVSNFKKIRTGRANPDILDNVIVSYYGVSTPLREMATIAVPEPMMITIKPWDRNALADIELAIRNSSLGLSPINDGVMVRLVLPPLTEERRKQIVKEVKKEGEQAKIAIRNIRGEAWGRVQEAERKGEATEDDRYRAEDLLNKLVAEKNKEIDQVVAAKEVEILKV